MYGKLFTQMFDGTLATRGPWQALVTFQQMVILADKEGIVDMTAEAISRRTTVPLEIIELGISKLEMPDSGSRTPDEDGRRIVRLSDHRDWGWRIVNHAHYRKLRSQEERREYMKRYQREYRKKGTVNQNVNNVSNVNPCSKQYAVSKKEPKAPAAPDLAVSQELWNQFKDTRRSMKAPLTPHAETLLCRKLQTLKSAGQDPIKVVEQSIERGWKGLFAIDYGLKVNPPVPAAQMPANLPSDEPHTEMPDTIRAQLAVYTRKVTA